MTILFIYLAVCALLYAAFLTGWTYMERKLDVEAAFFLFIGAFTPILNAWIVACTLYHVVLLPLVAKVRYKVLIDLGPSERT